MLVLSKHRPVTSKGSNALYNVQVIVNKTFIFNVFCYKQGSEFTENFPNAMRWWVCTNEFRSASRISAYQGGVNTSL